VIGWIEQDRDAAAVTRLTRDFVHLV
jgi:hypothetical protein